mmetsp:Transcript_56701/g.177553  ORF Transcript_56701/g.177553 Transcript_56701/m.177553 type:complete len:382 (+) Transcript_56701:207-1352(+)
MKASDELLVCHPGLALGGYLADGLQLCGRQLRPAADLQLAIDLLEARVEHLHFGPVRAVGVVLRKQGVQRRAADPNALQEVLQQRLVKLHGPVAWRNGTYKLEDADALVCDSHTLDVLHEVCHIQRLQLLRRQQLAEAPMQLCQGQVSVAVGVPQPERVGVALPKGGNGMPNLVRHRAPLVHGRWVPAHERQTDDGAVQGQDALLCEVGHHLVEDTGLQRRDLEAKPRQEGLELAQGHGAVPIRVEQMLEVHDGGVDQLSAQRGYLPKKVWLHLLADALMPPYLEAVQEADVANGVSDTPALRQLLKQPNIEHLIAERLQEPKHGFDPDSPGQQARHARVKRPELRKELVLALTYPLNDKLQDLVNGPLSCLRGGPRRSAR